MTVENLAAGEAVQSLYTGAGKAQKAAGEFENSVEDFLAGKLDAEKFKAARLAMGIYAQRQKGYFMVRTKIAAGAVGPAELRAIADASEKYSEGSVHLTTRQDIQFYFVTLVNSAPLLKFLAKHGVTTLGAGGNSIRNITLCRHDEEQERLDLAPYVQAVSSWFLGHEMSRGLPRKFKINFCAGPEDCRAGLTDDLAFIAVKGGQSGREWGFKVFAGGGLGAVPRFGKPLEEFVAAGDVPRLILAALRVFNAHGTRTNRNRARLKFLIERISFEAFAELYRAELDMVGALAPLEADLSALERGQTGPAARLLAKIPTGDLSANQLRALAGILDEFDGVEAGVTKNADIVLSGFAPADEGRIKALVGEMGFSADRPKPAPIVNSCNGAATCNEGITRSKSLAQRLEKLALKYDGGNEIFINISGCPNACGLHHVADIGLQGSAKRVNGRLTPHYQLYLGGGVSGEARLARPLFKIPAATTTEAVERILDIASERKAEGASLREAIAGLNGEWLERELAHLILLDDYEKNPRLYLDLDSEVEFSLEDVGPGECAGSALDIIDGYFSQARRDIDAARDEADPKTSRVFSHRAAIAAAKALLVTYGVEPASDEETKTTFGSRVIARGFVNEKFLAALDAPNGGPVSGDEAAEAHKRGERFIEECLAAYTRINATANLEEEEEESAEDLVNLNLSGVACPYNYIRIKLELEKMPVGAKLTALLDDGSPIRNVPRSLENDGHRIVSITETGAQFSLLVEKL